MQVCKQVVEFKVSRQESAVFAAFCRKMVKKGKVEFANSSISSGY
jgi:hypothetical protein